MLYRSSVSSHTYDQRCIGLGLLRQTLNEFASTSKSSAIGIAWEIHVRIKRNFEQEALKRVFIICVEVLQVSFHTVQFKLNRTIVWITALLFIPDYVL